MFVIPVSAHGLAPPRTGDPLYADFHFNDTHEAARYIASDSAVSIVAVTNDYVRVSFEPAMVLQGGPDERHKAASFVIDYDQSDVAALHATLRETDSERRPIDAITQLVDSHISNKSYLRGFDFASTTARSREGDCTEHAVLETALARAEGYPARVAFGIMLVEQDDELHAYSHAWSEIHDGERWHVTDATLLSADVDMSRVRHIPLTGLRDEGTGYSWGMLHLNLLIPSRIEVFY